jgi:hypothetical protein
MTKPDIDVPTKVRVVAYLLNNIGFPVIAFGAMFYMAHDSMGKMTKAIEQNTKVITEWILTTSEFRTKTLNDHTKIFEALEVRKGTE